MTWVRRLLRGRLVQFAIGGALLFAIAPAPAAATRVSLTSTYLQALHLSEARRLGVQRLSEGRQSEIDRRAVEDEVLYREALRLGLDRDDGVLREHLIQKMLLLAEDLGGASHEPTREEIRAYYDRTPERWREDEQVHLVHVFATTEAGARSLRDAVLASDGPPGKPPAVGEAFARSRDVRGARADLEATYGKTFSDAAFAAPPGTWTGPVESRFGWHLVRVLERTPGRPAPFDAVFARVRLEYEVERRQEVIARFLQQTLRRYEIELDGAPLRDYAPTRRVAMRSSASDED